MGNSSANHPPLFKGMDMTVDNLFLFAASTVLFRCVRSLPLLGSYSMTNRWANTRVNSNVAIRGCKLPRQNYP
jgi:hypothetical protein